MLLSAIPTQSEFNFKIFSWVPLIIPIVGIVLSYMLAYLKYKPQSTYFLEITDCSNYALCHRAVSVTNWISIIFIIILEIIYDRISVLQALNYFKPKGLRVFSITRALKLGSFIIGTFFFAIWFTLGTENIELFSCVIFIIASVLYAIHFFLHDWMLSRQLKLFITIQSQLMTWMVPCFIICYVLLRIYGGNGRTIASLIQIVTYFSFWLKFFFIGGDYPKFTLKFNDQTYRSVY